MKLWDTFSIGIMLTFQSLADYYKKFQKQLKIIAPLKLDSNILCVITQSFKGKFQVSWGMCKMFQEYPILCQFYYRNDRERIGTFTDMCETLWKIYTENKHSCYFAEINNAKICIQ